MTNIIKFPTARLEASGVPGGFKPALTPCRVLDLEDEKAYLFAAHCEKFIKQHGSVPLTMLFDDFPEERTKSH